MRIMKRKIVKFGILFEVIGIAVVKSRVLYSKYYTNAKIQLNMFVELIALSLFGIEMSNILRKENVKLIRRKYSKCYQKLRQIKVIKLGHEKLNNCLRNVKIARNFV